MTRAREDARSEAIQADYARLPVTDPARMAHDAMGPTTGLITLPNARTRLSPRELTGTFVTLFGTADPELLDHEGKSFRDRVTQRTLDVFGHSLSLYTGPGTRRHVAHDTLVEKVAEILTFAGVPVAVEDAEVFRKCISDHTLRGRYLRARAMGRPGGTGRELHGIRPDLSVARYRFAQSPRGPSQLQLWDVKTIGVYESYSTNYLVPPADQRARRVPNDYRRAAVKCDREWNGTPAGATGAFEGYLASLPPVLGLGFGAFGEWSTEVDTLIGQMAEIASEVPERLGCCHGSEEARGRYAHWARKNLHRVSLRELSRCRHAALDRILLIPTETYVGDPEQCSRMDDSPDDPGISNAWDSPDSLGASGGGSSRGA